MVSKNQKKTSIYSTGPDWADELTSELSALSTIDEVAKGGSGRCVRPGRAKARCTASRVHRSPSSSGNGATYELPTSR